MRAHDEPKTLFEARNVIKSLRAQLGGGKPIPKDYPPTNPALPANPPKGPRPTGGEPIPKTPEDPYPILPGREPPINPANGMDLGALAPRKLQEFLECCSTVVLNKLLSVETSKSARLQDSRVVQQIYREIKRR